MIFRLARYSFWVIILILGAFGINLFPGKVNINWLGYDIDMDVTIFVALVLGFLSILLILLSMTKWVLNIPQTLWQYRQKRKLQKADRMSLEGLEALAAGELKEASELSATSLKLKDSPLALVVAAQTAYAKLLEGQGDFQQTSTLFTQLYTNEATKFLGLRGLILLAQYQKNDLHLLPLLEETYRLRPQSPWVLQQLLQYDLAHNRLEKAGSLLDQMQILKAIPASEATQLKATIAWRQAQQFLEAEEFDDFYDAVTKTLNLNPGLMNATVALARYYAESNREAKALKTVRQGFAANPSVRYTQIFEELSKAYTSIEALRFVIKATDMHPSHPQTFLLRATFAIKAQVWGEARQYLDQFKEQLPINRSYCLLMESLEAGQNPGQPHLAQAWRERALLLPEEPIAGQDISLESVPVTGLLLK